jgi:hypothetical protein
MSDTGISDIEMDIIGVATGHPRIAERKTPSIPVGITVLLESLMYGTESQKDAKDTCILAKLGVGRVRVILDDYCERRLYLPFLHDCDILMLVHSSWQPLDIVHEISR